MEGRYPFTPMVTLRPHRQLTLEVAADFKALGGLRDRIRHWLRDAEVADPVADDLLLVATELCTNAIEATPAEVPVEVTLVNDGSALRLAVANTPASLLEGEPPALRLGSLQERGRGLAIVRSLVDTFVMTSIEGRTVVRTMQLL